MQDASSESNNGFRVITGWTLFFAGILFLIAAFITSKDIISIFLIDLSRLRELGGGLVFATCGAYLVASAVKFLTLWGKADVLRIGIIAFLLPLTWIFFPITIFIGALADILGWWLIGFTVIVLFFTSDGDDEGRFGESQKLQNMLTKSLFVLLPLSGLAMWILTPRNLANTFEREIDKGTLDLVSYMFCSVGFMSGLLAAILITSATLKFKQRIRVFLILLLLSCIWTSLYLWQ